MPSRTEALNQLNRATAEIARHREAAGSASLEAAIRDGYSVLVDIFGDDHQLVGQYESIRVPDPTGRPFMSTFDQRHSHAINRFIAVLESGRRRVESGMAAGPSWLTDEADELDDMLTSAGFRVAARHFRQAVDNSASGRWESCNGQLRSMLEALLPSLLREGTGSSTTDPVSASDQLRNTGMIDGDEDRLIKGLLGLSNERGAHAGISSEEEARFRLQVTSTTARYLLMRLGGLAR